MRAALAHRRKEALLLLDVVAPVNEVAAEVDHEVDRLEVGRAVRLQGLGLALGPFQHHEHDPVLVPQDVGRVHSLLPFVFWSTTTIIPRRPVAA